MTGSVRLIVQTKALDDDQRTLEGWATRPEEDRVGDTVLPRGATYKLPLPFLLDHDHSKAVGHVDRVEVTDKGIRFWAHIKKIVEPGEVQQMCDTAWQLVKNGLRQHVSIGFRILDAEPAQNSRGLKIKKWEWLELSAVSVPALASATITGVKAIGDVCVTVPSQQPPAKNKADPAKPHIYVPSLDLDKDFESARKCFPGLPVSPERSHKIGKHWHMYSADGCLLGVVPPLPEPKAAPAPNKSTAPSHSAKPVTVKGLEAFGEVFGKAVGDALRDMRKRIAELESIVQGQQAKLGALSDSSLKFAGEFQEALDYKRGAVVKSGGDLYTAVRDVQAGKSIPGRHGAGWTKMTD